MFVLLFCLTLGVPEEIIFHLLPRRIFGTRSVFVFIFFLSKGNNFHSYCSCKTRKVKSCDKGLTHSDRHLLGHHRKSYVATLVQTTADHAQGHHRLCRQRANIQFTVAILINIFTAALLNRYICTHLYGFYTDGAL